MAKADTAKNHRHFLDKVYAGTRIADRRFPPWAFEKSTADLLGDQGPLILLAAALEPLAESIREPAKDRSGALPLLRPRYMEAMLTKAGGLVAPDANSTLRVTYGQVKGVDAENGLVYKPQTALKGNHPRSTRARRIQRTPDAS